MIFSSRASVVLVIAALFVSACTANAPPAPVTDGTRSREKPEATSAATVVAAPASAQSSETETTTESAALPAAPAAETETEATTQQVAAVPVEKTEPATEVASQRPVKAEAEPRPATPTVVAVVAPPPPPPPPPRFDPKSLVGLERNQVALLMGVPSLLRTERNVEVWLYEGVRCVAHLYFYENTETEGYRVRHFETRSRSGELIAARTCLDGLQSGPVELIGGRAN